MTFEIRGQVFKESNISDLKQGISDYSFGWYRMLDTL